jgi:hypothetical protein
MQISLLDASQGNTTPNKIADMNFDFKQFVQLLHQTTNVIKKSQQRPMTSEKRYMYAKTFFRKLHNLRNFSRISHDFFTSRSEEILKYGACRKS